LRPHSEITDRPAARAKQKSFKTVDESLLELADVDKAPLPPQLPWFLIKPSNGYSDKNINGLFFFFVMLGKGLGWVDHM
jgi:hypothetical protein